MNALKQASGNQLTLSAFSQGSIVKLDGGRRLRLDDKADFWPGTGRWKALECEDDGFGMTTLLVFLERERVKSGHETPKPVPIATRRQVLCNYCGNAAQLHPGSDVYPNREDLAQRHFWVCWPCDAWVGCHKGGDGQQPFGSLANEELRSARISAHAAFDPLWRDGEMTKEAAYDWLAAATGIPRPSCHIGLMDVNECRRVRDAVALREGHAEGRR